MMTKDDKGGVSQKIAKDDGEGRGGHPPLLLEKLYLDEGRLCQICFHIVIWYLYCQ